jgi:NADPH:quinone reductase-like Zn-dependent oxidoreductase
MTIMSSTPPGQHLAAILNANGGPLEIIHRQTPTPGPYDLLIEVKSVALNPVDYSQRDFGRPPVSYPAVLGSDVAGTVISAGSAVVSDAPQPGTRVAAFATSFYTGGPDYGALQARVLVPAGSAVSLPSGMSFNEASLLPMAVVTAWSGLYTIGLARDTAYTAADKKGMLVWGAASSIGSAAVQIAHLMGFRVYGTASEKHHEYLKGLGASRMFDYNRKDVEKSIISAAKEDGVSLHTCFDAIADTLEPCLEVLKESKGSGTAKLAYARPLAPDSPQAEGVEVKFISSPSDEAERTEFFHFVCNVWLKEKLEKGQFVPSPKIEVVPGGLQSANKALDQLKKGVSGTKLVLEL